ncbi:MAG: hypothetical protein KDD20_08755 [Mangrovimonas sp.]|nr:hypothetical protein [Mangrovimonas sp.]
MFLKAFKEKSNKKIINSLLNSREVFVDSSKVEHLGVLLNVGESNDFEAFRKLADEMNILPNKLKIVAFSNNDKSESNFWDTCFTPKDFGWSGTTSNRELKTFLETSFDVLISYYAEDLLELKMITAQSQAKFKVGIFQKDDRLNDLIIKTPVNQFGLFKKELIKYLTIFKKLKHAK